MLPRLPNIPISLSRSSRVPIKPRKSSVCLLCSFAKAPKQPSRRLQIPKLRRISRTRKHSNDATSVNNGPNSAHRAVDARLELRQALFDLHKNQATYVNIARLQLALHGLQQRPGDETIRIAILALADVAASFKRAKELLRLILADPLKPEEEWETQLFQHKQGDGPLLIKVGHNEEGTGQGSNLMKELHVDALQLRGHNVEFLLLEVDAKSITGDEESVLSPVVNIPTSSTGRVASIALPVYKALVVGDGMLGATALLSPSRNDGSENIVKVADIRLSSELKQEIPMFTMDTLSGRKALKSIRASPSNAMAYEHEWFASKIPDVSDALRVGTTPTDGAMKSTLRSLISSLLLSTYQRIEMLRANRLQAALSAKLSTADLEILKQDLTMWAERAHTELQMQLEIAFEGPKWTKLAWWKLFWRVDDVTMIFTDILQRRYLPSAEKEIIYLAGIIGGKGVFKHSAQLPEGHWVYRSILERFDAPRLLDEQDATVGPTTDTLKKYPWPLDIPASRNTLCLQTIPSLQALAQKLVLQTLSTSSVSSALAGLLYVSSLSLGLYEVGAVAALGTVWSLRRMQQKWEIARGFWKGEVREEGRKAIRGIEIAVGDALKQTDRSVEGDTELEAAGRAVERAQAALEACK